ncbi:MAG: thioesterase II family protein [Trebonia sp.]
MNADHRSAHRIVMRSLPAIAAADGEQAPPDRVVYCVPAAGAGARSFLNPFARSSLRACLRVVQLPGREDRLNDPCIDDIMDMAALIAAAIAEAGAGDYALFGHSFGALVMLETARRLEQLHARTPALLAVAACPSPRVSSGVPFGKLEPADLATALRGSGRLDSADPLGDELAALVMPSLDADCGAVARYLGAPGHGEVASPILAMGGALDQIVTVEKMASWRECTQSDFEFREYPGGHFFPLESDLPLRAVAEWRRGPGRDAVREESA